MKRLIFFLFIVFSPQVLLSVDMEKKQAIFPIVGDELVKYAMDFSQPLNDVIDLQNCHIDSKMLKATIIAANDNLPNYYCLLDNLARYYSHLSNDSLFLDGFENNLTEVRYSEPLFNLCFPLGQEKEYTSNVSGKGIFAEAFPFEFEGNSNTKVSKLRSFVMPNGVRILGAMLVYRKEAVNYRFKSTVLGKQFQTVVFEKWQVYVPGVRYAVVEQERYSELNGVIKTSAYYYPIDEQPYMVGNLTDKGLDMFLGEDDRKELADAFSDFSYTFSNSRRTGDIVVSYSSSSKCMVSFVLANSQGMVYHSEHQVCEKGIEQRTIIKTTGFPHGQYVIYINVNGQVKSEKININ